MPEIVNFETIVMRIYRRWATTEDWFGTICKDAMQTYQSPDFKDRKEMMEDIKKHI